MKTFVSWFGFFSFKFLVIVIEFACEGNGAIPNGSQVRLALALVAHTFDNRGLLI